MKSLDIINFIFCSINGVAGILLFSLFLSVGDFILLGLAVFNLAISLWLATKIRK
jgi:hypothetical protein